MFTIHTDNYNQSAAWDCNPELLPMVEDYDYGLDDEQSETDWQVLALDRFGDRLINGNNAVFDRIDSSLGHY